MRRWSRGFIEFVPTEGLRIPQHEFCPECSGRTLTVWMGETNLSLRTLALRLLSNSSRLTRVNRQKKRTKSRPLSLRMLLGQRFPSDGFCPGRALRCCRSVHTDSHNYCKHLGPQSLISFDFWARKVVTCLLLDTERNKNWESSFELRPQSRPKLWQLPELNANISRSL